MHKTSLLLLVALTVGCATSGNPAVLDQAIVSQIKVGQSTKEDVRRLFGNPTTTSITQSNNYQSEVWAYGYAKHDTNPLIYVPIIGLFALASEGYGNLESGSVAVAFDKNGVVQSVSKYKSAINMGGLGTPTSIQSESSTQSGTSTDPVQFKSETKTTAP